MRKFTYDESIYQNLSSDIVNLLSEIHEYKGKHSNVASLKPDILANMLKIAKIQSTGASNRIEGIFTSDARLKSIVSENAAPLNRSENEITGYRDVLTTIHENYEHIPITKNTLLQLHRDLYKYAPLGLGGNFKSSDNIIEETTLSGEKIVRFKPVSAFETPDSINSLCEQYNKAMDIKKVNPLILTYVFILDFLCIHPFSDGNGRISRLLTLLSLYKSSYDVGKYISIERIIEKTKDSYYDSLQKSSLDWHDSKNDYNHFLKYMLEVTLMTYKEFDKRIGHITDPSIKLSKPARIKKLFSDSLSRLSKSDILEKCPDISKVTVEKTLGKLLKEDYILKIGKGRATKYTKSN